MTENGCVFDTPKLCSNMEATNLNSL